jgi:hypothetical protein
MSHFTVTICLDDSTGQLARAAAISRQPGTPGGFLYKVIEQRVSEALAPFDENTEVTPYRSYEEGGPEDHWLISSIRRGAEQHRQLQEQGAEALALQRVLARDSSFPLEDAAAMVTEHAAEWARDAEQAATLPEHLTWADVVRVYKERFGDDGDEPLHLDEDGRAYTMTTYNPGSKWDWWAIGGRWTGYYPYRRNTKATVITGEAGLMTDPAAPGRCDGGPLSALDLDAMRTDAAAKALKRFQLYQETVKGTPEALPWSVFAENISEGSGYTRDQARAEYDSQPRVERLNATEEFGGIFAEDPIPEFAGVTAEVYAERARARAVPGSALLTADGRWMAPGRMGWFAMSDDDESSRIGYQEAANAYIGSLPDSTWLVTADCHI